MDKPNAESFSSNFKILSDIAEHLRTGQPDIDQLMPMIDQASAAYKICKSRIEAVKKAFQEKMPEEN